VDEVTKDTSTLNFCNMNTNQQSLIWQPAKKTIEARLKQYVVPFDSQSECESEK